MQPLSQQEYACGRQTVQPACRRALHAGAHRSLEQPCPLHQPAWRRQKNVCTAVDCRPPPVRAKPNDGERGDPLCAHQVGNGSIAATDLTRSNLPELADERKFSSAQMGCTTALLEACYEARLLES